MADRATCGDGRAHLASEQFGRTKPEKISEQSVGTYAPDEIVRDRRHPSRPKTASNPYGIDWNYELAHAKGD